MSNLDRAGPTQWIDLPQCPFGFACGDDVIVPPVIALSPEFRLPPTYPDQSS
jgi:hypothetical protein